MFSSSQFDATAGFSGGGFMSSQPSNFNDSSPAPPKSRETQGLVPVTVKQISEASQTGDEKSNFVINGVDLNNVTLVGMAFEKVERNTDVNFVLDDGTGRIKCRRWVNETFDTKEMEEVMPVTNFEEIPFHFIDCIHNHLRSKLKLEGITSTNPSSVSSLNTPVKNAPNGSQPPTSTPAYAQYSVDGLKDCDKLIIDYLQQHSDMSDERGIHVNELSRELKLPMDRIMLSLKTLGDDGLVYSTIDDYHYKQA
ncbi:Replication protein [Vigna angularis]|uniref:Replication protein n=1 Tax=Phaseolus angularis TaxID=3914 RepID=A0A8T0JYT6_PHAAN|nr:Replication protein [Vigna angularis]